jgi:ribosomal protein L11 methyltransferase
MGSLRPKRWVEISVEADRDCVDDLVNLLAKHCVGGAVVEERPDEPGRAGRITVKGFLFAQDKQTRQRLEVALLLLSRVSPISEPRITLLEPEDWAESWKAFFPPQHIGNHTVIVPTWHEYTPQPHEVVIRLDPGMAFGTGLHASTRLCLVAIERLLQPGMNVLDVGTGSGILAIAAALQGAKRVQALDIDPVAVQVARENVELNGVGAVVRVERGTLGAGPPPEIPRHTESGYDLLLVNILAEVIMDMAPAIAKALRPGGIYVGSGIISERADDVAEALREAGLPVDERQQEEDWVALIGHKA